MSCETQSRPGLLLVQNLGRVDGDVRISALMDEGVVTSDKCWSGFKEKMPEISKHCICLRSDMSPCYRGGFLFFFW